MTKNNFLESKFYSSNYCSLCDFKNVLCEKCNGFLEIIISVDFFKCFKCSEIQEKIKTEIIKNSFFTNAKNNFEFNNFNSLSNTRINGVLIKKGNSTNSYKQKITNDNNNVNRLDWQNDNNSSENLTKMNLINSNFQGSNFLKFFDKNYNYIGNPDSVDYQDVNDKMQIEEEDIWINGYYGQNVQQRLNKQNYNFISNFVNSNANANNCSNFNKINKNSNSSNSNNPLINFGNIDKSNEVEKIEDNQNSMNRINDKNKFNLIDANNHKNFVNSNINLTNQKDYFINKTQDSVEKNNSNSLYSDNVRMKTATNEKGKNHNFSSSVNTKNEYSLLSSRNKLNNLNLDSKKKNLNSSSKYANYNISEEKFRQNIESPILNRKLTFLENKENDQINNSEEFKISLTTNLNPINNLSSSTNSKNMNNEKGNQISTSNYNSNSVNCNIFYNLPNNNYLILKNQINNNDKKNCFDIQSKIFNKPNSKINENDKNLNHIDLDYKNANKLISDRVTANFIPIIKNSNNKVNYSIIRDTTKNSNNSKNAILNRSADSSFFDNDFAREKCLEENNTSFFDDYLN